MKCYICPSGYHTPFLKGPLKLILYDLENLPQFVKNPRLLLWCSVLTNPKLLTWFPDCCGTRMKVQSVTSPCEIMCFLCILPFICGFLHLLLVEISKTNATTWPSFYPIISDHFCIVAKNIWELKQHTHSHVLTKKKSKQWQVSSGFPPQKNVGQECLYMCECEWGCVCVCVCVCVCK